MEGQYSNKHLEIGYKNMDLIQFVQMMGLCEYSTDYSHSIKQINPLEAEKRLY
jgi:hypothetical protein